MKINFWTRYALYLGRWQLSTFILAPCVALFKHSPSIWGTPEDWIAASVSNLIGGMIFFFLLTDLYSNDKIKV